MRSMVEGASGKRQYSPTPSPPAPASAPSGPYSASVSRPGCSPPYTAPAAAHRSPPSAPPQHANYYILAVLN